jgi:hypothetical protein
MNRTWDVIVVGGGVGGICGALQAARSGARTLLLEQGEEIGGTGVHSPLALICGFWSRSGVTLNTGIHQELFPEAYGFTPGKVPVYDHEKLRERYHRLLAAEPLLTVQTRACVTEVMVQRGVITMVQCEGGLEGELPARVYLDGTADGNLAALAGAPFQKGRENDGGMQPSTLTFKVADVDVTRLKQPDISTWEGIKSLWAELNPFYEPVKSRAGNEKLREDVLCFPYPDGKSLLFNQTRLTDVDPTKPGSVEKATLLARAQIEEFWEAIRQHPALHAARIDFIAPRLGVREGRRIIGEYILTAEDCLGEAHFDDMVAACGYPIDIHNPDGRGTTLTEIPGDGYYHIPYRSLIAKGLANLLISSRCISGTHEAHSSYRVMSSVSAIGQAAGAAAALAVDLGLTDVREVKPEGIRQILRNAGQFVEGSGEEAGAG